jgi:hypothetical protein
MSLLLIHTNHFPPKAFHAITLFPFVFYNGKPLEEYEIRHEKVHLYQQLALLILLFYLLYLIFWIVGLVRYRNSFQAYQAIPFERSAYRLQSINKLSFRQSAFDWLFGNQ